ncbi:hypothetical protein BCV19_14045 [Vibrio splendidus]|uniref:Uncharacterized protein n=1 Tax=Vibrio splendidus TaxID=29497 RepID=A0A2N7CBB7_VIBSP|nr:hypothetical protein BCV19_14045 [Vibrio splendidus]
MFILATNDTESTDLDMAALLEHYKSQQKVERGFRFLPSKPGVFNIIYLLKNGTTHRSFTHCNDLKPNVYAGLEHKIREELAVTEEFFQAWLRKKYPPS